MDATLITLNVVMAVALWWKRDCKVFALIQTLQLLEIYPMRHSNIFQWMTWYHFNAAVNLVAVCFADELPCALWPMLIWSLVVECYLADRDCAFQLRKGQGFPSDAIYWLGNLVLAILLVYAFHKPILWLKEHYARRSKQHPTSNQAAAAGWP